MKSRYLQRNKKKMMERTLIISCVHFYYWMKPRLLLLLLLLLRLRFRQSAAERRRTVDEDPLAVIEGGLPVGEGEEEEPELRGRLAHHQKPVAATTVKRRLFVAANVAVGRGKVKGWVICCWVVHYC